jgi:putative flippase GtrA
VRTSDRLVAFNTIGVIGFIVQTLALWLLAGVARLPAVPATALAVELAVLHNFIWHVRWTWADRPAGWQGSARRLVRFNLTSGAVSLLVNVALMAALRDVLGLHYLVANLAGVACASVANYLLGDRVVFPAHRLCRVPSGSES